MAVNVAIDGRPTLAAERRKVRPIVAWAAFGVLALACQLYLVLSWILSGEAVRQPTGPTPVPAYMQVGMIALQVFFPVTFVLAIYYFLVRPWRREGRVTTDGLLCIVFALIWWQDPLADFMGPWSIYNTYPVNFGSWLGRVPGIPFPQAQNLAEPIFMTLPSYLAGVFAMVVIVNWGMRRAQMRWPNMSNFRLITGTFLFFFVFDFIIEIFLLWIGWYSYPGTIKALTFLPSEYIRFPIYEAVIMSVTWTAFACLRYFKNDNGETIAERGSAQLRSTGRRKTLIRFLALNGIINVMYFTAYNLPVQYFAVNMDTFPTSITERSYFLGNICGEGTNYHCPGPDVPIPRGDSAHVGPDGQLVPAGAASSSENEDSTDTTTTTTSTTTTTVDRSGP